MTRILIADDHNMVRDGLKQIISKAPDMMVTAEATDGVEALEKAISEDCDVVLLDISMPGRNGLDVLERVKRERPLLPILILSVYPEETYGLRAMRAGASGYLTKNSTPERLIAAIREVAVGRRYISSSIAERLDRQQDSDCEPSSTNL